MNISFFIGEMVNGGAEKVLSMLANDCIRRQYNVEIVLLLGPRIDRTHFDLNEKINIVDLSQRGRGYVQNLIPWLCGIRAYVKKRKPNCIISFIGRINALVLTATIGLNVPIIVSERNDPKNDRRGTFMLKYCDWIYQRASAIVFQTSYQKGCFSRSHFSRGIIIPNPLNIVEKQSFSFDKNLVVSAGRLNPQKNQQMLINAMSLVRRQVPNVKCDIYGDGDLFEELLGLINEKEVQGNVFLRGKKSNVTKYVEKAEIFVMTSDREGLSNALMEAMMLGRLCITTDYPGVEDIIEDGVNGIIVPRGDVERLSTMIVSVLNDSEGCYNAMRQNARQKSLRYDANVILDKWNSVICDVVEEN